MNNVKDFGALGDGINSDTAAIQRAIDAGGDVYFPAGTYKTGTLYLHSNCLLLLDQAAVIRSGGDEESWNSVDFCPQNRASKIEMNNGRHLIAAYRCSNVAIRGGRIDGNAGFWYDEPDPEWPYFKLKPHNGQMLFFCECSNVRISDCELTNSPYWHCFFHGCENVFVSRVGIHSDPRYHCNDGIDIDCCRNVTVSDCIIETGDDALTLRGNNEALGETPRPCENVVVTNCVLSAERADGIRLGVGNGCIRNCTFSNIVIHNSNIGIETASSFRNDTGVDIENIEFDNIRMDVCRPFQILLGAPNHKAFFDENVQTQTPAHIRNIGFSRIRGTAALGSRIRGNRTGLIDRLRFTDIEFDYYGKGPAGYLDDQRRWDRASGDAAFEIMDAGNIAFEKVRINWCGENSALWNWAIRSRFASVSLEKCDLKKDIDIK